MFDLLHFVNENNEKQFIIIVDINIGIFNVRDESSVYSFIHFIWTWLWRLRVSKIDHQIPNHKCKNEMSGKSDNSHKILLNNNKKYNP